jgi:hypothetical protein
MLYLLQFPAAITRTPTTATVVRWMATAEPCIACVTTRRISSSGTACTRPIPPERTSWNDWKVVSRIS